LAAPASVRGTFHAKPDDALVNDWHVVAFSKDVADGQLLATRLLGEELVIWRHAGKVQVWKDLCIHRGSQLSKGWVVDGTVVCPYHGWRYDCDGKCVLIPAHPNTAPPLKARAFAHRVEERYGFIWGSLGDPRHDIPPFPEWDSKEFRIFHAGPYPFGANAFRSVENFLDATHFPFVHAGLNGVMDTPDQINDYKVTKGPQGAYRSGHPAAAGRRVRAGSRHCRNAAPGAYSARSAPGASPAVGSAGAGISALAQGARRHLRHLR
jgi:phenylpropionate dioxygenase-like ring-hydroxylating dioxygenase large terminal subunit